MKELTKHEIIAKYKEMNPIAVNLVCYSFALILGVIPTLVLLIVGITTKMPLIPIISLPIVLPIGLFCLDTFMLSHIRESKAMKAGKYRIIRAKCTNVIYEEGAGDCPSQYRYSFETDDKTFELIDKGVPEGEYGYLIALGDSIITVFRANEYYNNDYRTTFYNSEYTKEKKLKEEKRTSVRYVCFATVLLAYAVMLDVIGCIEKDWVFAVAGGICFLFSLLSAIFGDVRTSIIKPIFVTYLFVNGGLFCYLSYMYNHSKAAYIVGSVYILVSLICFVVWIKKSKK